MIEINGSSGGGQILRSALSLSMVTAQPFHIKKIRGARPKPGLMRQHLTCVRAAAEVCGGAVDGDELGSRELIFHPGEIQAGDYHFKIGTAGSTTLVAQTLLPALWNTDSKSILKIEGGTHNPGAPPFDFFERVYLHELSKLGFSAEANCQQRGFAPAGGGILEVESCPSLSKRHDWIERGELLSQDIHAIVAHIQNQVAERECSVVEKILDGNWRKIVTEDEFAESPGNVFSLELSFAEIRERITTFGSHNRRAEQVAKDAVKKLQDYLESGATVGRCLADQLILPLALGSGGSFITMNPSNHLRTNAQVIEAFGAAKVSIKPESELHRVEVQPM